MASRVCLVHYHEIGLKGNNRARFERILMDNIKAALAAFSVATITRISGHILVTFSVSGEAERAFPLIAKVPGVARVSLAFHTNREPGEYCAAAIKALEEFGEFNSFKVVARRSNTDYELTSMDLNKQVGEVLCNAFPDKKVLMKGCDAQVHVLVVQGSVYVYARSERGVGGLPQGSAGKVVTLLSSGIDSPVATWLLARRGAVPVPVHFSGRPQTADTSEYLCQDIIQALAPCVQVGRLYVIPFGDCQREISIACPSDLRVIMYRRVMYAVAERIAQLEGAKALVTGESLGQVASQTLENIMAVNEVVDIPVFRPLIGSDKQEIIARAEQIGTYDISTQTAPDCCTLFMPRRPETHAKLDEVHAAWEMFDHEAMIQQLVDAAEYIDFSAPTYKPPRCMRERHDELEIRYQRKSTEG
ncbi:tRNA uracil 4-sulfurtransferase ThiI [Collinsella tanakaei]|uniref:tRNA uracil 4-sulfurtransferase ThiI n=1 Tax=Collinsella tanakaei TaxID=626935 RepID=UPI0022E24DED|nr:tRNA uracil 4-sulfurtransferase ThiI [Collinsella tanakaei]